MSASWSYVRMPVVSQRASPSCESMAGCLDGSCLKPLCDQRAASKIDTNLKSKAVLIPGQGLARLSNSNAFSGVLEPIRRNFAPIFDSACRIPDRCAQENGIESKPVLSPGQGTAQLCRASLSNSFE